MSTELAPVDATNAVAVTDYLQKARNWLATAVDVTGPEQIAMAKAEIATAAEATKQLNLSKEIQLDAKEMVRRAEYALGKAIRLGQERGEVARHGQQVSSMGNGHGSRDLPDQKVSSVIKFFSGGYGQTMTETYALVDGVTDEQFDEAIDRAKEERNVSRRNVIRKVNEVKSGAERQTEKWDRIAELAASGHTRHQVADLVGMTFEGLARAARNRGIDFPADRAVGKRQRINSDRILSGVAESVSAAAFSIQQIEPLDLDQESAQEWVDSLTESINALRKAVKKIKESIQ